MRNQQNKKGMSAEQMATEAESEKQRSDDREARKQTSMESTGTSFVSTYSTVKSVRD